MFDVAGVFSSGAQRIGACCLVLLIASGMGWVTGIGSQDPPGEATDVTTEQPKTERNLGPESTPDTIQETPREDEGTAALDNIQDADAHKAIAWPKPAGDKPAWLDRALKQLETQQPMQSKLDQVAEVDIQSIPLEPALKLLLGKNHIPFQINTLSLEEEGIDLNLRIDLQGRGTIRELLVRMLRPYQLDFAVNADGLIIASHRDVPLVPRVYDLSHIANDNQVVGRIAKLIPHMVRPDEWLIAGGVSQSASMGSVLIILATDSVHAEVELFLGMLATMGPDRLQGPLLPAEQFQSNPANQGMAMPGLGGGMM